MRELLTHPAAKPIYWTVFAILFYNSGLAFTIWMLQPESFKGGIDWLWLSLFPLMLPAFFVVNRYCGCASGSCSRGRCDL